MSHDDDDDDDINDDNDINDDDGRYVIMLDPVTNLGLAAESVKEYTVGEVLR